MYFTIEELCRSNIASKENIDNSLPADKVENISKLIQFLDDLRHYYGFPILVTSGYRSKALNARIGGVSNSDHMLALAADLQPCGRSFEEFRDICKEFCLGREDFDQLIIESNKTSKWIHISVNPRYRRQIFNLNV